MQKIFLCKKILDVKKIHAYNFDAEKIFNERNIFFHLNSFILKNFDAIKF